MFNRQDAKSAKRRQNLTDQMDISGSEGAVGHRSSLVTDLDNFDQLPG